MDKIKGWAEGNISVVGIAGTVLSVKYSAGMHGGYYAVSVAVIPGTETEIPPFETARDRAATESELPEVLHKAFNGDVGKVQEFMAKVAPLPFHPFDHHVVQNCGRARVKAHLEEISGDPDFFMGADPNGVVGYIAETRKAF